MKKIIYLLMLLSLLLFSCSEVERDNPYDTNNSNNSEDTNNSDNIDGGTYNESGFRIIYNSNNATGGTVPVDRNYYETGAIAKVIGNIENLEKTDSVFYEWNTAPDGTGDSYGMGQSIRIVNEDVTLYAKWGSPYKKIDSLDFQVYDAEYSDFLEAIILVPLNSDKLYVFKTLSGELASVSLSIIPICVSVSPDGKYAAVGGDGSMEYVDLISLSSVKTITSTGASAFDIVLAGNGYAYIFPLKDQHERIICVKLSDNTITQSTGNFIYERTRAKLHPDGMRIYGADNGISPSDIEMYSISGGTAVYGYDSQYHGDYSMGGSLWISEDGKYLFTYRGNVFSCSTVKDMDMIYSGHIGVSGFSYKWIDHSSVIQQLVCIPAVDLYMTEKDFIELYSSSNLHFITKKYIPFTCVDNISYPGYGIFGFYSSNGSTLNVIYKVNTSSNIMTSKVVQY